MTNRIMYGLYYEVDTEINVISIKYKEYGLNKRNKY